MATSGDNKSAAADKAATDIVEVALGETVRLPIESLDGAEFMQEAGNLLVFPADGGEPILLQNFLALAQTDNPPKIEFENGDIVEIDQITPLVQGYNLAEIAPAAGDTLADRKSTRLNS